MDASCIYMFGVSTLLIVLGFIALLKQKLYVDKDSGETEVEIPFFGKLKSNYPALVFVLLGAALAFYGFQKSFPPPKTQWTLTGLFQDPLHRDIKWGTGTLQLTPTVISGTVYDSGRFEIQVPIEQGQNLESVFDGLHYDVAEGSIYINLQNEYNAFRHNNKASLLSSVSEWGREFKPIGLGTSQPPLQ
jgi:hypothetical protein